MSVSDYLPRHVDRRLADALTSAPVVILDGPRGAGKTTSAARLARSTVAMPRDLEAVGVDPVGYLSVLEAPVLVDEWQLAGTELLWTIKAIVDADPTPGRFILTGSVEPASHGPTYPLTARAVRLVMRPMTHAELAGDGGASSFLSRVFHGPAPAPTSGRSPDFDLAWLARPGFPGARAVADPALFLDAYAAIVSQRAGDEGRDASRLLRTMRVLATLSAQAVPDQRVWEAADVNKATFRAYDDLLLRVHLSVPSAGVESNRLKRLTTYPKRFLADTALALTLAEVSEHDLRSDGVLAGQFLEAFVMQQLRPHVDIAGGTLLHLRTSAGEHEVDAVVALGNQIVGFEVKHGVRPSAKDARHMTWLRDQLGDRFTAGYVVHTGGDTYPLAERIWALPIQHLTSATSRDPGR